MSLAEGRKSIKTATYIRKSRKLKMIGRVCEDAGERRRHVAGAALGERCQQNPRNLGGAGQHDVVFACETTLTMPTFALHG